MHRFFVPLANLLPPQQRLQRPVRAPLRTPSPVVRTPAVGVSSQANTPAILTREGQVNPPRIVANLHKRGAGGKSGAGVRLVHTSDRKLIVCLLLFWKKVNSWAGFLHAAGPSGSTGATILLQLLHGGHVPPGAAQNASSFHPSSTGIYMSFCGRVYRCCLEGEDRARGGRIAVSSGRDADG